MRAAPPLGVLLGLLALIAILPITSALGFGEVGGYRMFTRLARLQLSVRAREAEGHGEPITFDELAPHLGSDARRIVGAALRGSGMGDAAEGALRASLPALAELVCELGERRVSVEIALTIERHGAAPDHLALEHPCER